MSDLTKLSANELSAELTKGSVSAVEVTKAHLDRINSLDKTVQSFLHVDDEGALKQAQLVDVSRKEKKKYQQFHLYKSVLKLTFLYIF